MTSIEFALGGYRFVPGVFQYSAGVAALDGYCIERVTFRKPVPLAEGFLRVEEIIRAAGRPLTSFCACELRSPAPFTEAGFRTFNEGYVAQLSRWRIIANGVNPVARSNVCPDVLAPDEPSLYAFSFTIEAARVQPTFVIAGSGEVPEGRANYRDHIVCLGDLSAAGLREKATFVLGEMERRLAALGLVWADTTATQVYTVHDPHAFMADEIVRRGAAAQGLTWHYARPPIVDIEYEMDCRGIQVERAV